MALRHTDVDILALASLMCPPDSRTVIELVGWERENLRKDLEEFMERSTFQGAGLLLGRTVRWIDEEF